MAIKLIASCAVLIPIRPLWQESHSHTRRSWRLLMPFARRWACETLHEEGRRRGAEAAAARGAEAEVKAAEALDSIQVKLIGLSPTDESTVLSGQVAGAAKCPALLLGASKCNTPCSCAVAVLLMPPEPDFRPAGEYWLCFEAFGILVLRRAICRHSRLHCLPLQKS